MERADLGTGTSVQHTFFILYVIKIYKICEKTGSHIMGLIGLVLVLYVIRITGITDWRSTIGPNSPFNSKDCELTA
eukprot:1105617-Pelagomonas_calceolata.AAC.1